MIVNVPAQIISSEAVIVFGTILDNVIEGFHSKIPGRAELVTQSLVINAAAQGPDRVDKWQTGQLIPGGAQVPDFVRTGGVQKVQSRVTDEQSKIRHGRYVVARERLEFRTQALLGQQN